MTQPRRTDYDDPAFRAAWEDKTMTIADISRRYGTSAPAIYRAAMRRGFPKRTKLFPGVDYSDPRVHAMWHDPQVTIREIADHLGVNGRNVWQAAENRGWPGKLRIRAGVV